MYEASSSFDEAAFRSNQLNLFKGYTPSQVNAVLQAAVDNNQIYKSWDSDGESDQFIRANKGMANKGLVREYILKRASGKAG